MISFGLIGWGLKNRMSRDCIKRSKLFSQKSSSDQNSHFLSDQKIQKVLGVITSGFFL